VNFILQKRLPFLYGFFHLHKIFYTLFNSSTEFKLALYAQFFIEKLNRFQEIVEDSDFNTFNSHKPMRGTYIKFLENYNDLKSTNNYQFGNLSYEMISKVLSL
ncbi:YfbU family protein, partial [Enterococcus faecium]